METKTLTCETCGRPASDDVLVAPIDLGPDGVLLVCDYCCEEIAALLALLSVLR